MGFAETSFTALRRLTVNSVFYSHGSRGGAPRLVDIAPVTSAQDIEHAFAGCSHCIQLTAGLLSGFVSSIRLGAVTIYECGVDRGIELRFAQEPNTATIGFLLDGDSVVERGHPWNNDEVCVSPHSDIDLCAHGPSHIIWVRIDLEHAREPERASLAPLTLEMFADAALFADVRALIDRLVKGPRMSDAMFPRARLLYARSELARCLVGALQNVATLPKPEQRREQRSLSLVRNVEAFMWDNVEEPLTLERICKEMHCGVRALIYAFKDIYGVGPMTYWKVRRLNAAHRKLRASGGNTAILEVAADYGFWHMGHFSSDHKHMFGMTPSEAIEGRSSEQTLQYTS